MNRIARLVLATLAACAGVVAAPVGAEPVTLKAADGVQVYGEAWRARGARPAWIVAFHQAGASHAEYAPIAPRLVAAGFSVLAIDQRSGDGAFGGSNRTAEALPREATFREALPDLEAALAWARAEAKGAPVVAWGSSYSAALVFLLAAAHPADVSAVVSFSPGEYLDDGRAVRTAAGRVTVPVFIDQASGADEVAQSAAILRAVKGSDKQQFRSAAKSTHGASTLRADTNAAGAEAQWQAVLKFLRRFAP